MKNFNEAINEAIQEVINFGECQGIKIGDSMNTIIKAEWESMDYITGYDIVTLYFCQNDQIIMRIQIEETKNEID